MEYKIYTDSMASPCHKCGRAPHLSIVRNVSPVRVVKVELPGLYLVEHVGLVAVIERLVSTEQDVHQHAEAPHVDGLAKRWRRRVTATNKKTQNNKTSKHQNTKIGGRGDR